MAFSAAMSTDRNFGQGPATVTVSERVTYVAFHRAPAGPPAPPSARRRALKVHLLSGVTLTVDPESGPAGPLGFYARPAEAPSSYKEIFFYNHGIRLRELNEPLGEMLVHDGLVNAGAVGRRSKGDCRAHRSQASAHRLQPLTLNEPSRA